MAKIDKKKILDALKADLQAAEPLKVEQDAKIKRRKDTYDGKPYGNEEENKSKIVPKVAKRQSQWAHASLKDPFVSSPDIIKCNPITYEDVKAARQNQLLLNYQFCRQFDRYNFMTKAIKVLDVEATLVVQTGWEYEDEKIEVETDVVTYDENGNEVVTKEIVEDIVVKVNKPTAKVCRNEDIYIDPTCQDDLDKAQFIIYRYETDYSTLKQDGRYKNIDKIIDTDAVDDGDYNPEDETSFTFKDKPRKKILVYEYWGNYDVDGDGIAEPIVCAWAGNTMIRLEGNPYPDKKPPFLVVPYSSVPFQIHGENNIDLIEDNQKVITALTRGFINSMAQSTNGQVGIRKGALDSIQRKRFFNGKNFEFNGTPNDFWQGSFNQIPSSAFNLLTLMNNEVESLTGIKGFSGGINGNTLGSSATAAKGVLDAASVRRLDVVRSIAENLIKPLMRKWMAYNAEFLSEEEVIRVTNDEFVPIRKDDLEGNIDIDISISTAEDNAAKSQELSFLLQTLGNNMPFEMTQLIMAKIAKLSRVPDLEQEIKNYKPQPDPVVEELKKIQLEEAKLKIEKLKAEIKSIYVDMQENEGDAAEKNAQARLKNAQADKALADARKAKEEADLKALQFLKEDNQVGHKEKVELELLKAQANLESIKAQKDAGDTNIGIIGG